jgi:hypothetical protein
MKWILLLAPALVGCSDAPRPADLGREPLSRPAGAEAGETGENDAAPAAKLQLLDASLATIPREGDVSCFGQTGVSQLEWVYQESTSTAQLIMQETELSPVMMGDTVSCALMTALNADQCAATVSDSANMITWNVSYNPTTNTFAGIRYSATQSGGTLVTKSQNFAGNCLGSWGDI